MHENTYKERLKAVKKAGKAVSRKIDGYGKGDVVEYDVFKREHIRRMDDIRASLEVQLRLIEDMDEVGEASSWLQELAEIKKSAQEAVKKNEVEITSKAMEIMGVEKVAKDEEAGHVLRRFILKNGAII